MITSDYSIANITPDELDDLRVIADVEISNISLEDYPNLLVFPDSFIVMIGISERRLYVVLQMKEGNYVPIVWLGL